MKILLVEPAYYTQYPPLGLLKLSTFHKQQGDDVRFVRGLQLVMRRIPFVTRSDALLVQRNGWLPS